LIHTFAGPTMLMVNPMAALPSVYSDKIVSLFSECRVEDMPPHVYAAAAAAHRNLLQQRKDQAIVFAGRSGAGKSAAVKHALEYYARLNNGNNSVGRRVRPSPLTPERLSAAFALLEAFGGARTILNASATRFASLFSVDFDTAGQAVSASLQASLLEKSRVVRRPEGEPNFNVFYQMLAGLDPKHRRDLQLEGNLLEQPNLFMTPLSRPEDKARAASAWTRITSACKALGFTPSECSALWASLAAIFHLGSASVMRATPGAAGSPVSGQVSRQTAQFARPQAAHRAAQCLGTTLEELNRCIFQTHSTTSLARGKTEGTEALEGFVGGLYQETFNAVVHLINRCLAGGQSSSGGALIARNSILIFDAPGFQNPATCGRYAGATFEDLCHNYLQERLQLLFHTRTISSLHERYLQEQVDCGEMIEEMAEMATPAPMVALIDKQAGVRTSQADLTSADRRGLLWLLDEEALFPGATDVSFVERLLSQNPGAAGDELIRRGPSERQFLLQHFQGTNPVLYDAKGWLQASREDPASRAAGVVLQESTQKHISDLFHTCRGPGMSSSVSGSIAGIEPSHGLRRASSIRRAFTAGVGGVKRNSAALQVKFQV